MFASLQDGAAPLWIASQMGNVGIVHELLEAGARIFNDVTALTGDPDSAHKAGQSIRGMTLSETDIPEDDWEDYLIEETP